MHHKNTHQLFNLRAHTRPSTNETKSSAEGKLRRISGNQRPPTLVGGGETRHVLKARGTRAPISWKKIRRIFAQLQTVEVFQNAARAPIAPTYRPSTCPGRDNRHTGRPSSSLRFITALFITIAASLSCSAGVSEETNPSNAGEGNPTNTSSTEKSDIDLGEVDEQGNEKSKATERKNNEPLPMDCSECPAVGGSLDNMLCAFDLCDSKYVLDSKIASMMPFTFQCTPEDTYEAVSHFGDVSNDLAPQLNDSYALLATGKANPSDRLHSDDCSHYSSIQVKGIADPWVPDQQTLTYDQMQWTLKLKAPPEAKGFRFKYVFLSEEYDDYISSPKNDKFYAILNAPLTTDGKDKVINYTDCRDPFEYFDFTGDQCDTPSGFCCYVAINSALSDCCWYPYMSEFVDNSPSLQSCPESDRPRTDITGTGYECAEDAANDEDLHGSSTGWTQTTWSIQGGEEFTLTLQIHDTGDALWDSEVILDGFEFLLTNSSGTKGGGETVVVR